MEYLATLTIPFERYSGFQKTGKTVGFGTVPVMRGDNIEITARVSAKDRAESIQKSLNWYYSRFSRALDLPAHQVLVVNDPTDEVFFYDEFNCSDRKNRFLPEDVIERVIRQSGGKIIRNDKVNGSPNHLPPPLKRRRRRRTDMEAKRIVPRIYNCKEKFYHLLQRESQFSRGDFVVLSKRRSMIRIRATNLKDAIAEIRERGLEEKAEYKNNMYKNSISYLERVWCRKKSYLV